MPIRPALLSALLLLAIACWPVPSTAQVKRCAGSGGELIYTDRECAQIGATERVPRSGEAGAGKLPYRGGCARTLRDLVHELTTAIDTKDVNQLAGLYHWTGMSSRQADSVMTRLDAISRRPLLDVMPVYPRPPPVLAEDGSVLDANADGYFPQTVARRAPVGLRLEQTFNNGTTPARTVFGLRRHLGCWWLSL